MGDLAINGTVNDLAMVGTRPLGLSVAMVLEEGLELSTLERIVESMVAATVEAGVEVVTGDTKVVSRGQADGVYINTSGVGFVPEGVHLSAANLEPGDKLIVSGPIGDHGVAVMSKRAGLAFEADITSDSAPLNDLVRVMLDVSKDLHAMRDPTHGGLAAALNELAEDSREGRLVTAVAPEAADAVLEAMRAHPNGAGAVIIGEVSSSDRPEVRLRTTVGGTRLVDLPAGELLPRIC